jgi:hypothetical protein
MTVVKRVSKRCYDVKDLQGGMHNAHIEDMKPAVNMEPQGPGTLLAFQRDLTHGRRHLTKVGEIMDHRKTDAGTWEFLVHWTGSDPAQDIWESASIFLEHGLAAHLSQYLKQNNLPLGLSELFAKPAQPCPAVNASGTTNSHTGRRNGAGHHRLNGDSVTATGTATTAATTVPAPAGTATRPTVAGMAADGTTSTEPAVQP